MLRNTGFALLILGLSAPSAWADDEMKFKEPYIVVDGSASVDAVPDRATMRLGVVVEKPTAAEAAAEVAKSAASVIASLKDLGVETKDIRTYNLEIDPVVIDDRDPQTKAFVKRTLAGYKASTLLEVTIKDVAKAGPLASRVVETGANTFKGLSFGVSDYEEREDGMRAKAVKNAMRRAELYASGANMKLGRLLALNPDPDRGNAADLPTRKSEVSAAPVRIVIPVEPGVVTIGAHVSATWELVPE